MRIAVVSDIHGNPVAFEAVRKDLAETSPDLILHGGDLAHGGSDPVAVVDAIRDLGWPGVAGNADELLWRPESLPAFLKDTIGALAAAERDLLGEERLAWLRGIPASHTCESMTLVHASPASYWRAPGAEASDEELEAVYGPLAKPIVVYAHIHKPYVRQLSGMSVVNSGSVSLSFDGDSRASYLLLDESRPLIRRVAYDVDREIEALRARGLPCAEWTAKMLVTASPQPVA